jgi:hypothetical protein
MPSTLRRRASVVTGGHGRRWVEPRRRPFQLFRAKNGDEYMNMASGGWLVGYGGRAELMADVTRWGSLATGSLEVRRGSESLLGKCSEGVGRECTPRGGRFGLEVVVGELCTSVVEDVRRRLCETRKHALSVACGAAGRQRVGRGFGEQACLRRRRFWQL